MTNMLKRVVPILVVAAVTVAQVYGLPTNNPVVLPQYWQDAGVGEMLTRFGILGPSDGGAALRVDVASGVTAMQLNNGARLDLGDGGSDYLVSNGVNVSTPGALGIGSFTEANLPSAATVGTGLAFNLDAGLFYYSNGSAWAAFGNGSTDAGTVTLAKNYYVAKNGNDSTGDGSLSRPYLTIGAAITATGPYTNGYANIIVAPGTYTENLSITRHFLTITSASESPQNEAVRIDGTISISANAATSKYGDTIALQGLYVYYPSLASGPLVTVTGTGLFSVLITNCYLVQNTAASNTLLVDASNASRPRVNIQRSMIQKQTASSAAVVQLDRGDVWLQDVNIYDNVSGGSGAGVALRNNATLIADRVTIDKSTSGPGIDVQVATTSIGLQAINSTIINSYNGALTSPALYLSNTSGVAAILFSTNLSVLDVTGNVAIDGLFNGAVAPLFMVGTTFPITANGVNSSIAAAVDATKYVMQNGPVSAAASTGTNALSLYTTGSRLDLGGAANDYLYSNGFVASTPGPFQVGSFTQAALPAAADAGVGALAYNLDAGQPTYSNGTSWVLFSSLFDGGSGSSTPQYWFDAGTGSIYASGTITNPDAGPALEFSTASGQVAVSVPTGSRVDLSGGSGAYLSSSGVSVASSVPFQLAPYDAGTVPLALYAGAGALYYDTVQAQPLFSTGSAWQTFGSLFDAGTPAAQFWADAGSGNIYFLGAAIANPDGGVPITTSASPSRNAIQLQSNTFLDFGGGTSDYVFSNGTGLSTPTSITSTAVVPGSIGGTPSFVGSSIRYNNTDPGAFAYSNFTSGSYGLNTGVVMLASVNNGGRAWITNGSQGFGPGFTQQQLTRVLGGQPHTVEERGQTLSMGFNIGSTSCPMVRERVSTTSSSTLEGYCIGTQAAATVAGNSRQAVWTTSALGQTGGWYSTDTLGAGAGTMVPFTQPRLKPRMCARAVETGTAISYYLFVGLFAGVPSSGVNTSDQKAAFWRKNGNNYEYCVSTGAATTCTAFAGITTGSTPVVFCVDFANTAAPEFWINGSFVANVAWPNADTENLAPFIRVENRDATGGTANLNVQALQVESF